MKRQNAIFPNAIQFVSVILFSLFLVLSLLPGSADSAETSVIPSEIWDLETLCRVPTAQWGAVCEKTRVNEQGETVAVKTQKVWYEGESYQGNPTRYFAFLSKPTGEGPFPGMVLVHGGGGTAYSVWTELWAARGYVAIAMDLGGDEITADDSGEGDLGIRQHLPDGGPSQSDDFKFSDFSVDDKEYRQRWTWLSIAAIVRAHSLLNSLPFVDPSRTGATGISWGGYLTSILAGVDDRFQVVVPVYGCGYLDRLSIWSKRMKTNMTAEQITRWRTYCDPSSYLPFAQGSLFFVNGTDDFAYPLDIHRESVELLPFDPDIRLQVAMNHSHTAGWEPKEIAAYVNWVLRGEQPLPCLTPISSMPTEKGLLLTTKIKYQAKPTEATLYYSNDPGGYDESNQWQIRQWKSLPAQIEGETIVAIVPNEEITSQTRFFLEAKDDRGLTATTHYSHYSPAK